jgi:hypothetical protein
MLLCKNEFHPSLVGCVFDHVFLESLQDLVLPVTDQPVLRALLSQTVIGSPYIFHKIAECIPHFSLCGDVHHK